MKTPKRAVIAASGALVLAAPLVAGCTTSTGQQLSIRQTLSSVFVGPLQFAISPGSNVYVADGFTSTLTQIGVAKPVATGPSPKTGGDIGGVAIDPKTRDLAYTTATGDHKTTRLVIRTPGEATVTADLSGFEKTLIPTRAATMAPHRRIRASSMR